MISVQEAIKIIQGQNITLKEETVSIYHCVNRVSSAAIFAPFDVPVFDKSMMDGYAFLFSDYEKGKPIVVMDEVQAGITSLPELKSGEAVRIFTGAPLPAEADTVIPQEDVLIENNILCFLKPVLKGMNIALAGTQTQKGVQILAKGTKLTVEYLGFLATFGINELKVCALPKVGIITTGRELVKVGSPVNKYQTYDSNSVFLTVALGELGIVPKFTEWVDDDKEQLISFVKSKLNEVDILIFTGGVSVGDYDFVKPALEEIGVEELFYKVKQKPGKPIFAGKMNNTFAFGLPGNPGSVVACYHVYVKPFIQRVSGNTSPQQRSEYKLKNGYKKKAGLTHFVKAFAENDMVEILNNQMSYQMDAYIKANAFAILPEEQEEFDQGQSVEIVKFK